PPEGESIIREKLKNLEEYLNINDDGVDPLIKMAVSHYQFESIHPFADGNGRTGRILNILYLVNTQLLDIPILYLSKHIIDHKTSYYDGLESVTEKGEWHGWIHYVLDAIEQTSAYTQRKIDDIVTLMRETDEYVKVKCADIYSKELIEVIFRQVYCKRIFLENANIVRLKTAGLYLARLEKKGILKSVKVGKEKLFINKKLLEILKR
ncbi:MAG: Fic family protein, partial [Ignavibacteriales bacterium]|nr:Fic family protein [Ignavibacteriales bacterium]